ncbi:Apoptosis-inducing factor 1 [Sorochytrium milnesiophthora]
MSTSSSNPTRPPTVEIALCGTDALDNLQMKEFPLGGDEKAGTVLLSRVDDKFYATSHLCTHYRAPLVKGTLSADGRVKCPWHGACFRVSDGDIEDAPAIDAIESFPVRVSHEDRKVYVTVSASMLEKSQKGIAPNPLGENRRLPKVVRQGQTTDSQRVVILGGGPAGLCTAQGLREEKFTGKITIIAREPYITIDRPMLSKSIHAEADDLQLRTPEQLKVMDIEFLSGTEATSIDTMQKQVQYKSANSDNNTPHKTLAYDYLVLATGCTPRRPDIPNIKLSNIFTLRAVSDSQAIESAVKSLSPVNADQPDKEKSAEQKQREQDGKPNVVMVGSSFIAMELAAVLTKLAKLTVVGMEKVPFQRVLGERVGAALQKMHEKNKVSFRMNAEVARFEGNSAGKVTAVVLKDGERVAADVVVLGMGAALNTDIVKAAGIPVSDKDGSVLVDGYMRIMDQPSDDKAQPQLNQPLNGSVFAAGDIARIYDFFLTHEPTRIEHWTVAMNHGRQTARAIAHIAAGQKQLQEQQVPEYSYVPYFWTAQYGKSLRYAGHAAKFDDVVVRGNLSVNVDDQKDPAGGLQFEAYYVHQDKVLAVASLAKDPLVTHCAELMRLGTMPSAQAIRDGLAPLSIPLTKSAVNVADSRSHL